MRPYGFAYSLIRPDS